MTSSESEGHPPSRKRSRQSNSAEDGTGSGMKEGKKARGRPRVDTQDATAADRRRTQIRLAQRAYRQRKETTISSLKQQSTQLHSIIEQMHKTFLRFNDSALKSGLLQLNPALARELKHATETFTALSKTATEFEGVEDEQGETADQALDGTSGQQSHNTDPPNEEPLNIGWGYSANSSTTEQRDTHPQILAQPDNYFTNLGGNWGQSSSNSLVTRRQVTVGEIFDQSRPVRMSTHQQTGQTQQQSLPFGLIDLLSQQQAPYTPPNPHIYSVNIPTPVLTPPMGRLSSPPLQLPPSSNKTLPSAFTYSHEETTFARRLTRAALETGFHLLSTANARPSALNYVFKLSLKYLSLEQLRARFRMMLSRGINEELDYSDTPFFHLGNAGTHYPRKDANGNIIRKENTWTIRQIGPSEKRMARVENVDNGRWEDLDGINLSDFEGDWFDPYDVQGYLEEHYSCKLDPKSSFAECLIEEDESESPAADESWRPSGHQHAPVDYVSQYDSSVRRASDESSDSPSLVHSTTNSSTSSSVSITPSTNAFNLPEAPFGLDMSFNNPTFPDFSKFNNIDLSFDQTLGLDLAPGFDYGFPSAHSFGVDMNLGLDLMGEVESLPVVKQKRKKQAWLEVNKLIDDLIKHGICLGRVPGFRRKDVDMAVSKALVSTS